MGTALMFSPFALRAFAVKLGFLTVFMRGMGLA
jgi:hypothetical protein